MKIKNILIAIIIIYGLFAGARFGAPLIRSKMFAHEMDSQAGLMKFGTPLLAKERLLETARSYKVPVTEKNLKVLKDEIKGHISIETQYEMVVTFPPFGFTHTWKFHHKSEAGFPPVKRDDFFQ
ncbi:hypothetical protein EP232_03085 [bacterium]|nr:MAG: hypothetical protein EP232_03085 [bacterium]